MKLIGFLKSKNKVDTQNKTYFIQPEYIIDNDSIQFIANIMDEFPNKGDIFYTKSDSLIETYKDKFICINFDKNKSIAPLYNPGFYASSKYAVGDFQFESISSMKIIEIIKLNNDILEMAIDDNKRVFEVQYTPLNNIIYLEFQDYLYGPFNYIDKSDKLIKKIQIVAHNSNYLIRRIKKELVQEHILLANPYNEELNMDNRYFIYKYDILDNVQYEEELDFIDNMSLINTIDRKLKENTDIDITIDTLNKIRNAVIKIDNIQNKDEKINKLNFIIENKICSKDFICTFLETFFNSKISEDVKQEYLKNNPEVLKEQIERNTDYVNKLSDLNTDLNILQQQKSKIIDEINKLNNDKQFRIDELKNTSDKKVLELQHFLEELNEEVLERRKELEQLEQKRTTYSKVDSLEKYCEELEASKNIANIRKKKVDSELSELENKLEEKLFEIASKRLDDNILDYFIFNKSKKLNKQEYKYNLDVEIEIDDLIKRIKEDFDKINRKISENEIYNLLISITQNFLVIFAGKPGCGKTTLGHIFSRVLGLDNRYLCVPVQKGWMSSKDFIGYHNPLSGNIETANNGVYESICEIDDNYKNGQEEIPFVFMLDEANLSPIEHYWSDFLQVNNEFKNHKISLGNRNEYYITEGVRFIATINFDHTTELISPRLLDRAFVIYFDYPNVNDILFDDKNEEVEVIKHNKIISYNLLKSFFTPNKGEQLDRTTSSILQDIFTILMGEEISQDINEKLDNENEKAKLYISPRSMKAIRDYCIVASRYFNKENPYLAVDYAVAQKIIPMINGYGKSYEKMLNNLLDKCKQKQLKKSAKLISNIIESGHQNHDYYSYF